MVQEYKGLLRKATNSMDTDVDPVELRNNKLQSATKAIDPEPVSLSNFEDDLRLGK